jgi:putative hydrolase of the HAD superfamily
LTVEVPVDLAAFDVLTFDCYGTLIDWEAGLLAGLREALPQASGLADDVLLETYAGHEAAAERPPYRSYREVLATGLRGVAADLGASVDEEAVARFSESVRDWPAFPDSAEALARLKRRYRLVILSNVDRAGFAASNRRLGVEFDAILTAQDIGSYKPSPANFDALLLGIDELGVPRERLLHVAQSLFHDHVPAKAKGLPTVWINRRKDRAGWGATPAPALDVQPDAEFPSMAAFADAVDAAFDG